MDTFGQYHAVVVCSGRADVCGLLCAQWRGDVIYIVGVHRVEREQGEALEGDVAALQATLAATTGERDRMAETVIDASGDAAEAWRTRPRPVAATTSPAYEAA